MQTQPNTPAIIEPSFGGRVPTPTPGVKYPASAICLVFPPIPAAESEEIIRTMPENGLLEDIVLLMGPKGDGTDDAILDGRHRQDWCFEAGVEPRYRYFGSRPEDGTSPTTFAYVKNSHRRQYPSPSVRTAMATELQKFWMAEPVPEGEQPLGKLEAREKAAAALDVSTSYVRDAEVVLEEDPAAFEDLKTGKKDLAEVAPPAKAARRARKAGNVTPLNPAADTVRKNLAAAIVADFASSDAGMALSEAVGTGKALVSLDEMEAFSNLERSEQRAIAPLLTEGLNLKFAQRVLAKEFDDKDKIAMLILRFKANAGKSLKVTVGDYEITVKLAKKDEAPPAPGE